VATSPPEEGTEGVETMASGTRLVTLIPIRNMNRAIKFYTKAVGGKLKERGNGRMRNFWASMKLGDAEVWFIAPEKFERRTLAYTLLMVKNIRASVKKLQRNGVKFQRAERMGPDTKVEGPIAFESIGASAFFKDSEGNLMMVWQSSSPM
jgi:predicted enzyme related to lactoylglutathione lyase